MTVQSKEYKAFIHARWRCTSPKSDVYAYYGGRGIKFLFNSFEDFLADIGPAPPGTYLDRADNDKHYEPGNIRWVTSKESMTNKRQRAGTSGHPGISWNKRDKVYLVYANGKYIGIRKTMEAALAFQQEYSNGTKSPNI